MRALSGWVAVISGGGSGIGRASAVACARSGMKVLIADISLERAEESAALARATGAQASALACDVTQAEDIEALRETALVRYGRINLIMNNVGVIPSGRFEELPLSEWQRAFEVNLLSYVATVRAFLPALLAAGAGHIVNTASTAGLYPYAADRLPYSATKAAVIAFSEALSLDLRPRGIGVTCLCPGPVRTNILEQIKFHGRQEVRPPDLAILEPETVGEMVVQAVAANTFLLLTHPEVQNILRRRAGDPEGFLAEQIQACQSGTAAPGGAPRVKT